MIRPVLYSFALLALFVTPAFAKAVDVGQSIPAITATDQNGTLQDFDKLKGAKGLTVVFVRSVEWSSFCQRQLMDLSENAQKFKDAGYPVAVVSYDTTEKLTQFAAKFKTNLILLSDPRSEIIKSFGIFNDNYAKGTMAYGTPHPVVYVVNADKTVKAKFSKGGVQERPAVSEVLDSMKPEPAPVDPTEEFPQEEIPAAQAPAVPEAAALPTAPVVPAIPDASVPAVVDEPTPSVENVQVPDVPEQSGLDAPVPQAPSINVPQELDTPAADGGFSVEENSQPEPMEFIPPSDEYYEDDAADVDGAETAPGL